MNWLRWPSLLIVGATMAGPARAASDAPGSWPLPSTEEAWKLLPRTLTGGGSRLPTWARATARDLPRTTAAMLDLDYMHRTKSPLGPSLRGKMRWVAADANHCEYARATAEADLRRAGVSEAEIADLKAGRWSSGERDALNFALQMTVDASLVTDDQVGALKASYGEEKLVAMVLLLASAKLPGPDHPRAGRTPRGRQSIAAPQRKNRPQSRESARAHASQSGRPPRPGRTREGRRSRMERVRFRRPPEGPPRPEGQRRAHPRAGV